MRVIRVITAAGLYSFAGAAFQRAVDEPQRLLF